MPFSSPVILRFPASVLEKPVLFPLMLVLLLVLSENHLRALQILDVLFLSKILGCCNCYFERL